MEKLEARIKFLEIKKGEKGMVKKLNIFRMIGTTNNKYNLRKMIAFLSHQTKVSRSSYYNYLNSKKSLLLKKEEDLKSKKIILKAFNKKSYKRGA